MKTLFKAENLGKQYGSNVVLHDINIEIKSGEIIGLIGENGAGKSTLMKLIAGVEKPSFGKMWVRGEEYHPNSIIHANEHGVGMVFQEQSLVANLTVAQNIYLGREYEYRRFGIINWNAMNKDAKEALVESGITNIDPQKKVETLDFATRQMVEIGKVLNIVKDATDGESIILLDEATTVLSQEEIDLLFKQVHRMAEAGNAVIFISHRLDEVMSIADKIFVFKDGAQTASMDRKGATEELLYEKMVGKGTSGEYYISERQTIPEDEVLLEVNDLSRFGEFNNVSFKLHKGEVLGLCGVEGSGKESLCSVLCGDLGKTDGEMLFSNKSKKFSSPNKALKEGIISVPKDRRDEGIIGMLSVTDNIAASSYDNLAVANFILNPKKLVNIAQGWVDKLRIKCTGIDDRLNQLSGGNAQKVVFARAIESEAPIIILNHPTRGVDVGAKKEIYSLVRDITEKGNSVILLGDTLDEVLGLSSRILIMKDGLLTGEFDCPVGKKPAQIDVIQMMM